MAIRDTAESYEELKSGIGTSTRPVDCRTVMVQEVSLSYWMDMIDDLQEFVLPVYLFNGECLDGDGKVIGQFEGYCEA